MNVIFTKEGKINKHVEIEDMISAYNKVDQGKIVPPKQKKETSRTTKEIGEDARS